MDYEWLKTKITVLCLFLALVSAVVFALNDLKKVGIKRIIENNVVTVR